MLPGGQWHLLYLLSFELVHNLMSARDLDEQVLLNI
jgi:hypothetical protein